ncbi:Arc/MetJ-type ribon-helix-helix transcriptional regulator [Quisquiliibacterium transsilvanicum]|uniref:Arc/MetJ-type ribon-helix-helix transcriptional regulator n=2 Tax=Quisquiliibacterium transsilvanicum TaxID=1549638 RepID=A0A7W8HFE2_9BURK|nr:Arc/MetJ-type ribon-helix-helix transcriptional regulator [Quisquiliibacterium transsilvanicum]
MPGLEKHNCPCAFAADAVEQGEIVLARHLQRLGDQLAHVAFGEQTGEEGARGLVVDGLCAQGFCSFPRPCSFAAVARSVDAQHCAEQVENAQDVLQSGNSDVLDRAAQLRYIAPMKTATIPSVRVEPEFRAEVESVLAEGESLSEFVEASVRASVERRRVQAEFIARGLRSRDQAKRTGDYVDADDVVAALQRKLDAARARLAKPPTTRK